MNYIVDIFNLYIDRLLKNKSSNQMKNQFECLIKSYLWISILAIHYSCSGDRVDKRTDKYYLEKESELKINSLLSVELIDYYAKDRLFLGYTLISGGMEIVIVNERGDIVVSKNLVGEGPGQSMASLNSLSFSPVGNIWALTNVEILEINKELEIVYRKKYFPIVSTTLYNRAELLNYFFVDSILSAPYFIVNPESVPQYYKMDYGFYDSKLIEILPWGTDTTYQISPLSDRSISEYIDLSVSTLFGPVYAVGIKKNKIFLTGTLDNEITVYDPYSGKVVSRIGIDHEDFINLSSKKLVRSDFPIYNEKVLLISKNHKIHLLDDQTLLLDYITTVPSGLYEQKKISNPGYIYANDSYFHRFILFKDGVQVIPELSPPLRGSLKLSMLGNRLLFRIDPVEEQDFIQYEIYTIRKE